MFPQGYVHIIRPVFCELEGAAVVRLGTYILGIVANTAMHIKHVDPSVGICLMNEKGTILLL